MANFHNDEWIMAKIQEHYDDAKAHFPEDRIVGIFCQGSTNYGLDMPDSDIDTKLIVVPSFEDIAFNRAPISHTYVRENNEHIDFKDIRLMFTTFRKQNLNFLEILFTPYKIINPKYEAEWNKLIERNEDVGRYNKRVALFTMMGIAREKYNKLERKSPARLETIERYGYDTKQLLHLLRIEEFLERYINGEPYADCLISQRPEFLSTVKFGRFNLEEARREADRALAHIEEMIAPYPKGSEWDIYNPEVDELLDDIQLNCMRIAIFGGDN